jgi:hypothetical protein
MPSVREAIISNIVTTLSGMTIAGGYNFDYPQAQKLKLSGQDLGTKPAIVVVVGGETKNQEQYMTDLVVCTLEVWVFVWADHPAAQSALSSDELMDRYVRDIERALMADVTRGNNARDTMIAGHEKVELAEGGGQMTVRVDVFVEYQHIITDPNVKV